MKMKLMTYPSHDIHPAERAEEHRLPHTEGEWRHVHPAPPHPVPPHRRRRIYLEPDEEEFEIFVRIFGDEDSAAAALQIIQDAPPEIAVIAAQISELIRREEKC